MYISSVLIKDFRSFRGTSFEFPLGRRVTCISGHNGVGKSTLLAILSNCGELKSKEGRHLNGGIFRGEYSDIIKHDVEHDTTGEKVHIAIRSSFPGEKLEAEELWFRATAQERNKSRKAAADNGGGKANQKSKRYRLIPKKSDTRESVSKLRWPTYYLGLSRLYPAGEAAEVKSRKPRLSQKMTEDFALWYSDILGLNKQQFKPEVLTLSDVPKKKGAGVSAQDYGVLANSAGQDNVGQILLTVLSFRQLKEELGKDYNGGLLAIDELDATLHPAAQIKLYNFLQKKAKELDLQVVFTCHSLSLIEYLIRVGHLNDKENYRLLYLTRGRGRLEVNEQPTLEGLRADLNARMLNHSSRPSVPMILEDEVAKDLVQFIVEQYEPSLRLKMNQGSISFQQIALLLNSYVEYFVNSIAVLDPDVNRAESQKTAAKLIKTPFWLMDQEKPVHGKRRILVLPGTAPLEWQYWELVKQLEEGDGFFHTSECRSLNVTYETLAGQFCMEWAECREDKQKLDFCKRWYHDLPSTIRQQILGEWCSKNEHEVARFVVLLKEEYNDILSRIEM